MQHSRCGISVSRHRKGEEISTALDGSRADDSIFKKAHAEEL
jgi:hypothetical protein